ncbi:g2917 [Coccomyxa elongata]
MHKRTSNFLLKNATQTSLKGSRQTRVPEPLWANIASHMSTCDWAMVSGTCKTTFKVQPRTIDIPSTTPPAGVIWASKRLGSVEVLCLRPNGALGLAEACSSVPLEDEATVLSGESSGDDGDQDEEEEEDGV